ncbi:iron-sulfur cluster repair protein YtfE [Permianibacter aggregans]|uniref:Regulator of cell morphogenesis and NO signaling n=1 Tax=Permianibacter aggregans TaxID=1510150 RepID=A0A4R6UE18_9GAMM|nr:iron-sulfur cluster repair protein YtfE [Permianibacter aggregans]QGX40704.1 iron-sulfur cluster repair protein YtfE [Permianibacter aggregans]TDQ43403.1 regulator of cell morphogenesis and NO signaling [Permianibacter aggregans]
MNLQQMSLGEIARQIPGATALFHRHKLDFCCGGQQSLLEAAEGRGLSAEALAGELRALNPASHDTDWSTKNDRELIEHILSRYHELHRLQLPELIRLSSRVEKVHRDHPQCPTGLAAHLEQMEQELAEHMAKEEDILFPMLMRGAYQMVHGPIMVMRHEHDDHGLALAQMEQLAHGFVLPDDACNTWRALYLGLQTLVTDLMDHIHLENNILFHRVEYAA